MRWRSLSLTLSVFAAVLLGTACTRPSNNPDEIRQKTAQATANIKADATAMAQGVKEGLTRGNKVDINTATKSKLMALPGIDEAAADRIIANRPYTTTDDLVKRKVITSREFDRISGQIGTN